MLELSPNQSSFQNGLSSSSASTSQQFWPLNFRCDEVIPWLILLFLLYSRNAQITSSSGCHACSFDSLTAPPDLFHGHYVFVIISLYAPWGFTPVISPRGHTSSISTASEHAVPSLRNTQEASTTLFTKQLRLTLLFPDWFSQCVGSAFTFHVIRRPCWCPPLYCIMIFLQRFIKSSSMCQLLFERER